VDNLSDEKRLTPQVVAADIAREFREDARRWTQKACARDGNGYSCDENDSAAVCYCLRGAINKRVSWDNDLNHEVCQAFDIALGHEPTETYRFVAWNDSPGRTVGEVIGLCEKVAAS